MSYSLLKYIPANIAHEIASVGLNVFSELYGKPTTPEWQPFNWRGIHFANRLGLAGGVDKDADCVHQWQQLGCGFAEIGTITPLPQTPNSGKIIDRDWETSNLWNKMGFPSSGAKEVAITLMHLQRKIPIFINIGRNRVTSNNQAVFDYLDCVEKLKSVADVFVVNVSSPNTKGLRDLQGKKELTDLTAAISSSAGKIPILLKLSPDLSIAQLHEGIEAGLAGGASGFVLTNTTTQRSETSPFPKEGGVAGKDLAEKSKLFLKETLRILGTSRKDLLIVSVGGVLTEEHVQERLELGADLVEVYSALVFRGPLFFQHVAKTFQKNLMKSVKA